MHVARLRAIVPVIAAAMLAMVAGISPATATDACSDAAGTPPAAVDHGGDSATSNTSANSMDMEPVFDLLFIDMMIPHHESAVAMAELALERTQRQEVRELAAAIIAAQGPEIEQMQAWRASWYPDVPPMAGDEMSVLPGIDSAGDSVMLSMDDDAMLASLCAAVDDLDIAFIDAMTIHHRGAVAMAEAALTQAVHPELVELARAIVAGQTAEIEQMSRWRADWTAAATPVAG